MEWITKRINELEMALNEIESADLTNETKMVVLKNLKDEMNLLKAQKEQFDNEKSFVENGFKK